MAELLNDYTQQSDDLSNQMNKINYDATHFDFNIPGVKEQTIANTDTKPVDVNEAVQAQIPQTPANKASQTEEQVLSSAVVEAQKDPNISVSAHENTDKEDKEASSYTSSRGWTYQKPKDSHFNDAMLGMLGYMMGASQASGDNDWMAGAVGAYSMIAENQDKIHRFNQVDYLESQKNADGTDKYGSKDIDNFVQTGDYAKLVENKVKWEAAGAGVIFNPATGQFIASPNAQGEQYGMSGNVMYNKKTGKYEIVEGAKTGTTPRPPSLVATDANGNQTFSDGSVRDINGKVIRQGIGGSGTTTVDTSGLGTEGEPGYDEPGHTPPAAAQPGAAGTPGVAAGAPAQPAGQPAQPYKAKDTGTWMIPKTDTKTNTTTWSAASATQQKELDQITTENATGITTLQNQQTVLGKLMASPGFDNIYGTVNGATPNLRQDSVDADALRKQLSGDAFLQQRLLLKGQGAITDYESKRAEAAYSILMNPRISSEQAHAAAVELNGILTKGIRTLKAKQDNISIPNSPQTSTAGTAQPQAAAQPQVAGTYVPGKGLQWHQ